MKDLEKLMSKAGKSEMSEDAKKAKMEVIMELMESMKELMAEGVHKGMSEMKAPKHVQEVSVMAPDQEGLEEGLDMAKEVIESEEGPEHESLEDVAEMVADKSPSMVDTNKPEMEEEDEEESMFGKSKKEAPKKKMFNMFDDED